jgi:hypothetical protein
VLGDPREASEIYLLAKLSSLTTADGLPQAFRLVTRELTHLNDIKAGSLPCALLQMEEPEVTPKLSKIIEVRLPGRIIMCFPNSSALPASTANTYRAVIEKMLLSDVHLGGLVDGIWPTGTLMPGIWSEIQLLATGVLFQMLFEYSPLLPVVT